MYLSGPITFKFPDGHTEVLTAGAPLTWAADFLKRQGKPIRADGSLMTRSQILGGELFDSCPINVIQSDGQWLPEQLAAINSDPAVRAAVAACRYFPAPGAAPSQQGAPQLTANNAPLASSVGETISRTISDSGQTPPAGAYLPTGIATPTVITLPGGGGYVDPTPPAAAAPIAAGLGDASMLPLVGGLLLLGYLFSGKKKGRAN